MKKRKTISQRFNIRLAVIVTIALTASTLFIFLLNTGINNRNYSDIIASTLTDIENDIEDTSDINMLTETYRIREKVWVLLNNYPRKDVRRFDEALRRLVKEEELSEMSIVNTENTVIYSSKDEYIGFDMNSNEGSRAFDVLNHGTAEIVQPVRANAYQGEGNYDQYNKYAGVPLEDVGYLQIAINSQQFQKQIDEKVNYIAANRHIGRTGFAVVSNMEDQIVSYAGTDAASFENRTLESIGIRFDRENDLGKSLICEINGVRHLIGIRFVEGYYIIGAVPMSEVQSFRNRAALMNTATEIIIFALMFIMIRKMINHIIVSRIHNINGGLMQIIKGELDTRINEYSTEEFALLSDDINSTVSSLKDYMNREQEKIREELEFAKSIQQSALPKLSTIDRYREQFELYALMNPAREVGGDFYDFYMTDDSHLAVLVADVSGKGVPAAMFMMTCKTMLKNLVDSGLDLSEAFSRANEELCQSNDAGMFVTVWMGKLDLQTGRLEYVNAGHNPPLIYNEEGRFVYLRSKAGFVLTGMEGLKYKAQETTLRPGDRLFLYTDGVTEANDPDCRLYGEERLLNYMNSVRDLPTEELLPGLKKDIDGFVQDAEQFDDITMLVLRYNGGNRNSLSSSGKEYL